MVFSGFVDKLRAVVQEQENSSKQTEQPPREAYVDKNDQVAIPFSFQVDQHGARRYGLAYMPATEVRRYLEDQKVVAKKLGNTGTTPLDYGITKAEFTTGETIDSDTFEDLYKTFKKANFRFDNDWMVNAKDDVMMGEARKYINGEQEASTRSAAQNFFRNFKLNMGKGRA